MPEQSVFVRGRLSPRGVAALQGFFRWLFNLFADVEIRGAENLPPASQGCIVCPNHLSRFDAPLGFVALGRRPVTAFAADTYRRNWFFRTVAECVDVIWVHRGAIGPSTIKAAIRAINEGRTIGVAPEGTRSPTRALQIGRTGAAALALATGAPIVPMVFTGTEHLGAAMLRLRRIPLTVTFGPPFQLPPVERHERAAKLEEYTTEIMCRLAALLPPAYRGVYADHPRLKELLVAG
jgi:1-acyl-sn-glycerol-3-phosphate acyltransferase